MVIDVEQKDDVCIVRVTGRFAAGEDPQYLFTKKDEIKRLNTGKLLVDFREVPFIGSTALGFIVEIYSSITRAGGRFVVAGLQPPVRKILDATRLSTLIPLAADVTAGLAALHEKGVAAKSGEEQ